MESHQQSIWDGTMRAHIREFLYRRLSVSFAKSGDDIQLRQLVNQASPGTYVDVGSWHPTKASNTYYFSLRGWKGICIDPNPQLAPLYADLRPRDTFVNCAVGKSASELRYYMLSDVNSSMNTLDLGFLKSNGLEGDIQCAIDIPTRSLEEVLSTNTVGDERIDFFDIDVEGFDLEVLESNSWSRYRPGVVLVETCLCIEDDLTSDTTKYLNRMGYRLLAKTIISGALGNLLFVDDVP